MWKIFILAFFLTGCTVGYTNMSFPVDTNPRDISSKTIKLCYLSKAKSDFYSAESVLECVNSKGEEVHYEEHHTDLEMLSGVAGILGFLMGTVI